MSNYSEWLALYLSCVEENKTKFLKNLGKRIKDEREKQGKTSEALAYEMGISKGNLSEIERGLRDVRISTLNLIAEGLGCSLSKLLKDM